jgi:hypothetical protein
MTNPITVTSGTDCTIRFKVQDAAEDAIPFGGVSIMDASRKLADRLTIVETDLPAGEFSVVLEGTDPLKPGRYIFRWQAVLLNGDTLGSPEFWINVK